MPLPEAHPRALSNGGLISGGLSYGSRPLLNDGGGLVTDERPAAVSGPAPAGAVAHARADPASDGRDGGDAATKGRLKGGDAFERRWRRNVRADKPEDREDNTEDSHRPGVSIAPRRGKPPSVFRLRSSGRKAPAPDGEGAPL